MPGFFSVFASLVVAGFISSAVVGFFGSLSTGLTLDRAHGALLAFYVFPLLLGSMIGAFVFPWVLAQFTDIEIGPAMAFVVLVGGTICSSLLRYVLWSYELNRSHILERPAPGLISTAIVLTWGTSLFGAVVSYWVLRALLAPPTWRSSAAAHYDDPQAAVRPVAGAVQPSALTRRAAEYLHGGQYEGALILLRRSAQDAASGGDEQALREVLHLLHQAEERIPPQLRRKAGDIVSIAQAALKHPQP